MILLNIYQKIHLYPNAVFLYPLHPALFFRELISLVASKKELYFFIIKTSILNMHMVLKNLVKRHSGFALWL